MSNNKKKNNRKDIKKNSSNNNNNNSVLDKNKQDEIEELDKTGAIELTFDDERLEKTELLDVSFVEDVKDLDMKKQKEESNNSKKKKDEKPIEELDMFEDDKTNFFKKNKLVLVIIVLSIIVVALLIKVLFFGTKTVYQLDIKEVVKNDENIVFLGDSLFDFYDVDKYYEDRKVVNSGIAGNTTSDILKDLKKRVYDYNPSEIFILIGTNDLAYSGMSSDAILLNIEKIIDEISKNRPYAEINVISLFPINNGNDKKISHSMVSIRDNKTINKFNVKMKEICKEKDVQYIDLNSLLADENGDLEIDYTTEGLHLNDNGYEVVTNELKKYLD